METKCETLEEISADQQKRLEYTARQKALYDYNTLLEENYERGRAEEREKNIKNMILLLKQLGNSFDVIVEGLVSHFSMNKADAKKSVQMYW